MPPSSDLALLRKTLKKRRSTGRREAAVIVGAGLNMAAAAERKGRDLGWEQLLDGVAAKVGFRGLRPDSSIATWETYLCARASAKRSASEAERDLRGFVADALKDLERAAERSETIGRFVSAGYEDILSLSFDLRVAGQAGAKRPQGPKGWTGARASLARHATHPGGRIWFPHGDTARRATLKLGVRAYGLYLREIERAFRRHMQARRALAGVGARKDVRAHLEAEHPGRPLTWVDVLLTSPVVIAGASLGHEEWPLWWILHQRMRLQARRRRPLPAFYLCRGEPPAHVRNEPAALVAVSFQRHEHIWDELSA